MAKIHRIDANRKSSEPAIPDDFDRLLEALLAEHKPANSDERALVEQMAQSHIDSRQSIRQQSQLLAECDPLRGMTAKQRKELKLLMARQVGCDGIFYAALSELLARKKQRNSPGIELVSQKLERLLPLPKLLPPKPPNPKTKR